MRNLAPKPHKRSRTGNRDHSRKEQTEIRLRGNISFSNIQECGNGFSEITRRIDKAYLIHLLYGGAIDYLEKARQASEMEEAGVAMTENISRALDILHELSRSVRISSGDELAGQLGKLYLFWIKTVNRAKRLGEIRALDEVIDMIRAIRALDLGHPPILRNIPKAASIRG